MAVTRSSLANGHFKTQGDFPFTDLANSNRSAAITERFGRSVLLPEIKMNTDWISIQSDSILCQAMMF
jgi:hypothetical protein